MGKYSASDALHVPTPWKKQCMTDMNGRSSEEPGRPLAFASPTATLRGRASLAGIDITTGINVDVRNGSLSKICAGDSLFHIAH
jgi:hypothetical protein